MRNHHANVSQELERKIHSGQIGFGRLMSPEQVRFAVKGRCGPEGQLRDWCIATEIDTRMFRLLGRAETRMTGLSLYTFGTQRHILVSQIVGPWRHHMVLPLFGTTMETFLSAIEVEPLWMSLANGEGTDAFVQRLSVPAGFAAGVKSSPLAYDSDIGQLATATMFFANIMTLPELQPVDGIDEEAKHIRVSVVAPDEFHTLVGLNACSPESSALN